MKPPEPTPAIAAALKKNPLLTTTILALMLFPAAFIILAGLALIESTVEHGGNITKAAVLTAAGATAAAILLTLPRNSIKNLPGDRPQENTPRDGTPR